MILKQHSGENSKSPDGDGRQPSTNQTTLKSLQRRDEVYHGNFQSHLDFNQKLFFCSASAARIVDARQDLEEIATGKALIVVPGVQSNLVFGSVATSVMAQNEEEALRLALAIARETFAPAAGWTSHVVNLSCGGNFHPFAPAFG
jgi:hypothetical protein